MKSSKVRSANHRNGRAVKEVLSGHSKVANAAWWGFDEEDSTEALQKAIDSGARRVIVPNMSQEWIVRPINLSSDQELFLERGVILAAKRGEYRGRGDSVLTARDASNLVVRGYGATVRMQKEDYIVGKVLVDFGWERWFGQYEKAEWRHPLSLRGCSHVRVEGISLRDSGGDGIYVAGGTEQNFCRDIQIRDVLCDNNYRQGISIISVDGLSAENSVFANTWGTPPSSGLDIEPDSPDEVVKNVVFRRCQFNDNYGDGIELFLTNMREESGEVSMLFDECRIRSTRGSGIRVAKIRDDGPRGTIEFRGCVIEGTEGYGIKIQDKSAGAAQVIFRDCTLRDVARNRSYQGAWSPIWIHLFRQEQTRRPGGVEFVNCAIEDRWDRPAMVYEETEGDFGLFDLCGEIEVENDNGARAELGEKLEGVTLSVRDREW